MFTRSTAAFGFSLNGVLFVNYCAFGLVPKGELLGIILPFLWYNQMCQSNERLFAGNTTY